MPAKDFPFLASGDVVYLDSAAVCPSPQAVVDAVQHYLTRHPLNYGVGVSDLARDVVGAVDAARAAMARLIGAERAEEVVFTRNTSDGINQVALGLPWQAGDEVVVTDLEHQANLLPWLRLKDRGVRVRVARASSDLLVTADGIRSVIGPRTRLVAVTALSNLFGGINPLAAIGQVVKSQGALYLVDAAQAGGRIPVDVRQIGCDFAVFCGRKSLLGPQGTACLYQRGGDLLEPIQLGSRAASLASGGEFELLSPPGRYEAGMPNALGIVGLGASAGYLEAIDARRTQAWVEQLTLRLVEETRTLPVSAYTCTVAGHCGGVVSLVPNDGRDVRALARTLWDRSRIIAASGPMGSPFAVTRTGARAVLRVSLHGFNDHADVETLVSCLREVLR